MFSFWWCVDILVAECGLHASCCFYLLSVDSMVRICLSSNLHPIRLHQFIVRSNPFTNLHFRLFRVHRGPQITRSTELQMYLVDWLVVSATTFHSFQWLHHHILWQALSASCPTLRGMLFFLLPTSPMSFKNVGNDAAGNPLHPTSSPCYNFPSPPLAVHTSSSIPQ